MFNPRELRVEEWNHEAHVLTAAYFFFEQGSFYRALTKMKCFIIDFGARRGNSTEQCAERYNETMTCFWVKLISDQIQQNNIKTFEDFRRFYQTSPQLFAKDLIWRFYTRDELFSDHAKAVWVVKAN